ncbi:ABC transporter substrate-binding protein [Actinokineospora sp. HUAS TT18]|uniref:ABC transporter substrate-binding protein n=1 Tax=Actinokineospora sp. HUAS TT18 TaxID=3447451 RepID=UPI003F5287C9
MGRRIRAAAALGLVVALGFAVPADAAGPRHGGTLRLVGLNDVDHFDTASAYSVTATMIQRAYTRQLVTYPTTDDPAQAGKIVADLATEVPTAANGGISADGRTYEFRIRRGAKWDAPSGPRQVTAADAVRGIKRLCNPVAGTPAPQYFTETIAGMAEYCQGFAGVAPETGAIARYIAEHDVAGVQAVGELTVRFTLSAPNPDFLDILALGFSSPAPREYLRYLPDSPEFRRNVISDGPYRIASYTPGEEMLFTRNPAWNPRTDPVRRAYVDRIHVREGVDRQQVVTMIDSGAADATWDLPVPPDRLAPLLETDDPRLHHADVGMMEPYLVINMLSPNQQRATSNLLVRKALQYGVDKAAVADIAGGSKIAHPACQILPPTNPAYRPYCPYETPGHRGDPAKARQLLTEAGYPNGVTLKMLHSDVQPQPAVAQSVRDSLARAGITVELVQVGIGEYYGKYLAEGSYARDGSWDIVAPNWRPDWLVGANARGIFSPLFDGSAYTADSPTFGSNYGFYKNPRTDELIHQALTAPDSATANTRFQEAESQILADAAVVPIVVRDATFFVSSRVRGAVRYPNARLDPTNGWLAR